MKTFFVLCFTLCLEGSCKGMLVFNTFSLALLSKVSNLYMVEVLCNAISTLEQGWNHFLLN